MTTVNNILTLLSTHHVGSPYLRFSLWPTPLRPLTIDPTDPNLWYAELLHRRSSGVEGLQDFYAIAVVPADGEFCVQAILKRICLVQPLPPGQFSPVPLYEPFERVEIRSKWAQIMAYLNRLYPEGTPIEELDVELDSRNLREVVKFWFLREWPGEGSLIHLFTDGFVPNPSDPFTFAMFSVALYPYMTPREVWLEAQRAEFEKQLFRSPLESGVVVSTSLPLIWCWGGGAPDFIDTTTSEPGRIEDWRRRREGTSWTAPTERPSERVAAYRRAVFTWNALEDELTQYVASSNRTPSTPLSADHPSITSLILESLSTLSSDNPLNHPIAAGEKFFGFSKTRIAQLRKKGIVDFRGLARTLLDLPIVERYNEQIERVRDQLEQLPQKERPKVFPEPLPISLKRQEADRVYLDLKNGLARHSSGK